MDAPGNVAMTTQSVGRCGEHLVQAELERRGWSTSNLNAGHPNAPKYDILAWTSTKEVCIRVKTVGSQKLPGRESPVYNVEKGTPPSAEGIGENDFTVFVLMGQQHHGDRFYVVPTRIVRDVMAAQWLFYYSTPTKKGTKKVDNGQLTLFFQAAPNGEDRPGYNLTERWKKYADPDAWQSLHEPRSGT